MGLLDFFRRKKEIKVEEQRAKYVLKKKTKAGWTKVMDLPKMMSPDELYPALSPGVYVVHKYEKGASGFTDSGPVFEVMGEEKKEEAVQPRTRSVFSGLREMAEDFKGMKEDLAVFFTTFGPIFGFKSAEEAKPKSLLEELKEARMMKEDLDKIFPSSTTKSQEIPISGSIPAWMVYAPKVVDESMENIEKRLRRWGVVEEAGGGIRGEGEFIKLPGRPAAQQTKKMGTSTTSEKGDEIKVEMPKKPVIEKNVREVEVEKVNKKKGESKSGKSEEGKGSGD